MKKYFFLISFSIFILKSQAQNQLSFSAKTLASKTIIKSNGMVEGLGRVDLRTKPIIGYGASLDFMHFIKPKTAIGVGLEYTRKGFEADFVGPSTKERYTYVGIVPIISQAIGKKVCISIAIPFNYLADVRFQTGTTTGWQKPAKIIKDSGHWNTWDIGLKPSVHYQFTEHFGIFLEGFYSLSFVQSFSATNSTGIIDDAFDIRYRNIGLGLGIRHGIF